MVVSSLVALALLVVLAGWASVDALKVLPAFLGLSVSLVGVIGLVRVAWSTPQRDLSTAWVHVALVLAGGVFTGGGWGAGLGLGLLGSAALIVASRKADKGGEPD